jgi:hypothetical protein
MYSDLCEVLKLVDALEITAKDCPHHWTWN